MLLHMPAVVAVANAKAVQLPLPTNPGWLVTEVLWAGSSVMGGTLVRRARAGHAPGIFFDPCPTGDLLGGALSAVCAQCNYLDG